MVITSKLSNNELLEAIHKAAAQYSKLIGNEYLVIGKNKNSNYFWFQCRFEKKIEDEKYSNILVEIKHGLFSELYPELLDELKALIIDGVGQKYT